MSSIKEHLFDVQSNFIDEWVRERLSDDSLDEESEEYQNLANHYLDYQEHLQEKAEWEAELEWLNENGSSHIHNIFVSELDNLKLVVENNLNYPPKMAFFLHSNVVIKMSYAYAVTLLEAFLSETLKSIISENKVFLKNAIGESKALKNIKLSDLADVDLNVKSLVLKIIGGILFHQIPNAKEMYEQVLGCKLDLDISRVVKITKLRHDIVHRNGRTIDGESINIYTDDFYQAIDDIKMFSWELQRAINKALAM